MEIPFWQAMVCEGCAAYTAKNIFNDTENWQDPAWCYQRFGRTITQLPDGRIVEIAGEHEDYYDPDFCIYNDVVVYQGDGNFHIFGYKSIRLMLLITKSDNLYIKRIFLKIFHFQII